MDISEGLADELRCRSEYHRSQQQTTKTTAPREPRLTSSGMGRRSSRASSIDTPTLTAPLPSVQLQPFKNQVGGHRSIFRFSQKAVCKPLASRENQFYEAVERDHPELLDFIPQYLGVLNVTYRQAKTEESALTPSVSKMQASPSTLAPKQSKSSASSAAPSPSRGRRCIFKGQEKEEEEVPEVALDLNRHLIPEWMLRCGAFSDGSRSRRGSTQSIRSVLSNDEDPQAFARKSHGRSFSNRFSTNCSSPEIGAAHIANYSNPASPLTALPVPSCMVSPPRSMTNIPEPYLPVRPSNRRSISFEPPHKDSSSLGTSLERPALPPSASSSNCIYGRGSTTVNRRLQEQVLREVFSSPMLNTLGKQRHGRRTGTKPRRRVMSDLQSADDGLPVARSMSPTTLSFRKKALRGLPSQGSLLDPMREVVLSDVEKEDSENLRRIHSENSMHSHLRPSFALSTLQSPPEAYPSFATGYVFAFSWRSTYVSDCVTRITRIEGVAIKQGCRTTKRTC